MTGASALAAPGLRRGTTLVGAGCFGAAGLALVGYLVTLSAGRTPVTGPLFMVADVVATSMAAALAIYLGVRGNRRLARWITALTAALALYAVVVSMAFAGSTGTTGGQPFVVAAEGFWYMVVLTIVGRCTVVAIEEVIGRPASLRSWTVLNAGAGAACIVVGLGAHDPSNVYPGVQAPLAWTPLGSSAAGAVFFVLNVAWMATCVIPPVLAARAAAIAPMLDAPRTRQRLSMIAIAGATPLLTLITCTVWIALDGAGLMPIGVADSVVTLAFCVPPVVLAIGSSAALLLPPNRSADALRVAIGWVLTGLWVLIGAQLATATAALVAALATDSSVMWASAIAVALSVCFVAAYFPVLRRILRFASLTQQPSSASPADLQAVLSPRELEVLALIARGDSNSAIAASLHLSERTVDSHVTSIFNRLGLDRSPSANRRVQAAALWHRADARS